MIDAIAIDHANPPAIIQPARGRGRSRGNYGTDPRPRTGWTAYAIGALVLLTNGTQCEIIEHTRTGWLCEDDAGRVWRLTE